MNEFKGTLYDILGYFAPGLLSIITTLITYFRIKNPGEIISLIMNLIDGISSFDIFLLIIASYALGHALASISSALIEKSLLRYSKNLRGYMDIKSILNAEHYSVFCNKYKEEFKADFNEESFRNIICYVQSKQNSIYETGVIFLSFYGMARNFACIFFFLSIVEMILITINSIGHLYIFMVYMCFFTIFFYEYIRFTKYFRDTIISGFLIREETNKI